jgi:hypothetical protein
MGMKMLLARAVSLGTGTAATGHPHFPPYLSLQLTQLQQQQHQLRPHQQLDQQNCQQLCSQKKLLSAQV